jgi:hypothetical protein
MIRQAVKAIKHPDGFHHGDKTDETGTLFCQLTLDNLRSLLCLNSVILCEVAHENIRIQTDHGRLVRCLPLMAP